MRAGCSEAVFNDNARLVQNGAGFGEKSKHLRDRAETLHLGLQLTDLFILPVEDIPAYRIPGHPVGKTNGIGSGKYLLGYEQLRCFTMVAADLIYPQGNCFILGGVLAFDQQYRDAVDQENNILASTVVAVMKGILLSNLKGVAVRILVVNQDQITLTVFLMVEELAPVTQVLDEFPVALNGGVEMAELAEQCALGLGIARVEFSYLGIE